MIVVVDAYNAIRFFEKAHGERLIGESVRARFIARMQSYAYARRSTIREIVVVFDGGEFRWASREARKNLVLVYAGQAMSADDWILDFLAGRKVHEYVMVSDDRKLAEEAESLGAFVLSVAVFFDCVAIALEKRHQNDQKKQVAELIEYSSDEDQFENSNNLSLRELMEDSTRDIMMKKVDQAEDDFRSDKHVEKTQTRSKEELRLRRIMKKL